MSSKPALALLAVMLVMVGLASPLSAHADDETTVTGTVRTMFIDPVRGDPRAPAPIETRKQVLTVGDEIFDLEGDAGPSDQQVRVTGSVDDDTFQARRVSKSQKAARLATAGTTNVLVMLAQWTAPDSFNQADAATIFADTNGWYRDASYGALGQTATVTPWLQISGPTNGCYEDSDDLMARAKSAATAKGYNVTTYDNFILYFPECGGDADGLAGWGFVGASGIWINGGYFNLATVVHEEGHNYGLDHTHAQMCTGGGLSGSCTFSEYGDPYDTMGDYYCATAFECYDLAGHFSASQKSQLGWLGARTVNLTEGGTTTLLPMAADAAGPHAAVVALSSGRKYWLEYRQPVDYDSDLPTTGTDGLLVHVTGPGTGTTYEGDLGPSLIDVRPAGGISVQSATLRSGSSWVSPEGYTFSVGAVTTAGAALTVSSDSSPPEVVATLPAQNAAGQSTSPVLSATFDSPVTGVSNTTFTLKEEAQPVPATVTYSATTKTATLTPTAALKADTHYTLSLTAGIKNAAGVVALSPQSWSFLTGPRPAVIAIRPAAGTTGIFVGTVAVPDRFTATFSEDVVGLPTAAAPTDNFTLFQGANFVASYVIYNPTTRLVTLSPEAPLEPDKTYTLKLSSEIADPAGNGIAATSWNIITGPRPTVVTTAPKINAVKVSRTANLAARFSESVTGLPAKPAANYQVVLKVTSSGSKVTVASIYNPSTKIVTINPSSTLKSKTKYTVSLGSGIKDVAGNALAPFSWSFTTA